MLRRRVARVVRLGVTIGLVVGVVGVAALAALQQWAGWRVQTIVSGSMEPGMPIGAVAISRPIRAADVRVDDVVTFVAPDGTEGNEDDPFAPAPGAMVTHRVVAIEGAGTSLRLQTKGDANEDDDPWLVSARDLRGDVVGVVPVVGRVLVDAEVRRACFALVVLAGGLVIAQEVLGMAREMRRPKRVDTLRN
ncbi:MAG TPA: signal peptidase I [Mycobacteriales bacterium]|nr:signal peptidase I [Mycobacteriales bacterium]